MTQQQSQYNTRACFKAVGIAMFAISMGTVGLRLFFTLLVRQFAVSDVILDTAFSVSMQVGLLTLVPWLIYRSLLKFRAHEVMHFSYVRRTRWLNILISILLGCCAFVVTIGVSAIWQAFLIGLGYTHSPNTSVPYVAIGGAWSLLLSIAIIAVLPGFCEEFAMRGGLLGMLESTFGLKGALLLGGLAFGLAHQNIVQVFYTAGMGVLLVYITIMTKSLWPACIIHFINNAIGVYLSHAAHYSWAGGGFYDGIVDNLGIAGLVYMCTIAIGVGLMLWLKHINTPNTKSHAHPKPFLHNGMMVSFALATPITLPSGVLSGTPEQAVPVAKYKPTLQDSAFYIAAIVVAALYTIFSFVWGLY